MNLKFSMVLALMTILILPSASIYAWQSLRPSEVPIGPRGARDTAVEYIIRNHEEVGGLTVPSSWAERNLTPEGLLGYNKAQYTAENWRVEVSNAVVLRPTYAVDVEFKGDLSFQWQGTVDSEGNVVETLFSMAH